MSTYDKHLSDKRKHLATFSDYTLRALARYIVRDHVGALSRKELIELLACCL